MRLADDDELYEVDQTYLGPPGRYIAAMRHKAIFAWFAIAPLVFVTARQIGLDLSFMTVGLLLIFTVWAAMAVADRATTERPLSAVIWAFWNDLKAPRAARRIKRADTTQPLRSRTRGPLSKYAIRRKERG